MKPIFTCRYTISNHVDLEKFGHIAGTRAVSLFNIVYEGL